MTQRRLSTVFDYSNLRLHPDGTRVYQKADNVRPHLVKKTSEGPRGSWIARDAGGSGRVSLYRKPVKDASKEESGEEIDLDGDGVGKSGGTSKPEEEEEEEDEEGEGSEDEGDGRKRKLPQHTKRKLKRQKFSTDFDYLQEEHLPFPEFQHSTDAESVGVAQQGLSEPSTDLLKSIHRFAAEFYTERGQLLNISREYRNERKMRRLQKLGKGKGKQVRRTKSRQSGASSGPGSSNVSEEEENGEGLSEEENDDDDDQPIEIEEEDDQDGDEEDSDQKYEASEGSEHDDEEDKVTKKKRSPRKGKGRATRKRSQKLYTDMYKMFDGSAILAIGMLVQEMITHTVDTDIPVDWKEEMEQVYGSRMSHEDDDDEENPSPENERKDRRTDEEAGDEQDEGDDEGENENEDEDHDGEEEEDEDASEGEDIAGEQDGSPPLTTGDLSGHSDVDMKTGSGIETLDPDEEESHDESDSD